MIKGINHCVLCIVLALAFILQGCVAARKPVSEHQTLKGDNSTTPAMKGELQLPESGFTALSALTDQFAQDLVLDVGAKNLFGSDKDTGCKHQGCSELFNLS